MREQHEVKPKVPHNASLHLVVGLSLGLGSSCTSAADSSSSEARCQLTVRVSRVLGHLRVCRQYHHLYPPLPPGLTLQSSGLSLANSPEGENAGDHERPQGLDDLDVSMHMTGCRCFDGKRVGERSERRTGVG